MRLQIRSPAPQNPENSPQIKYTAGTRTPRNQFFKYSVTYFSQSPKTYFLVILVSVGECLIFRVSGGCS